MSKITKEKYLDALELTESKGLFLKAFEDAKKNLEKVGRAEKLLASLSPEEVEGIMNSSFNFFDGSLKSLKKLFIEKCGEDEIEIDENYICSDGDVLCIQQAFVNGWLIERVSKSEPETEGSVEVVFKVSKDSEAYFYKFAGYYTSYYGTEFKTFKKVEPKDKKITVYE
jgi:hypothetical protein